MGQITAFDGVRGIGVLMVIAVHAAPLQLESWSSILDVFFVISGFLITTLLLEEGHRTGTISLRRFYSRRAWRLLPGLYTLLAIALVLLLVAGAINDEVDVAHFITKDIIPAGLYYYNFANPLGYPTDGVVLFQMWSLSLEEQFYVVGALLVLLLVRSRQLVAGAVVMTVAAILIEIARARGDLGPLNFWLQRPDALLIGVVIAIVNSRVPADLSERAHRWIRVAGWAALTILLAVWSMSLVPVRKVIGVYVPFIPEPPEGLSDQAAFEHVITELPLGNYWIRWGFTVSIWVTAVLVFVFAREKDWIVGRALSVRPVRLVGRMSYVLYLFHTLPLWLVVYPMGGNIVVRVVMAWILAFALSTPVYLFVEKRALQRKKRHSSLEPTPDGTTV
jgi:peptidoglycan/LPS O-acetylase OafA/YrhL